MFDVIWTAPNIEKVGERKARKEKEQESKDAGPYTSCRASKRESTSTRRSSSSVDKPTGVKTPGDKPSSLFGSFSLKKNRLSSKSKSSPLSDLRIPIPETSSVTPSLPTTSTFSTTFSSDMSGHNPTNRLPRVNGKYVLDPIDTSWQSSCVLPSVGSSVTERAPAEPQTPTSLIPMDGEMPSSPPFRVRTAEPSPVLRVAPRTAKGTRGTPNTRLPRTSFPRSPKWPIKFQAHNPDRWRTPEEWDASPCAELPCSDVERQLGMTNKQEDSSLSDLASVRSELKKMEQLARRSILFRFQEKLAGLQNPSAYRETEMGNKRLMLFALGALDRSRHVYPAASTPSAPRLPLSSRILALFETEATASYLAAANYESSITHLAPSPLSPLRFPNVRRVVAPISPKSVLSLESNCFTAAYCVSLPSILSSQEIPGLLRNIQLCLLRSGILHLILIDPAPSTVSTGPRMRQWMEDNLLLNLERHFRCTNPRKLVPLWLDDAGMRADNSTTTLVKCPAVCPTSVQQQDSSKDDKGEGDDVDQVLGGGYQACGREDRLELELRSRICRMLWQEVWGSYVNGSRWWWDDPECVEECIRLETYWEYSIVEAVKDL